jgi:uncharacterized glyoxalase superfamily metalloenzyme YdcJ
MGYNVRLRASGNKKRLESMDDRQQRQVNEAAEKFAEAIRESFQAVSDRTVSAQQLNAELTQTFFNSVIENLHAQAEGNRVLTQELVDQQERQREAAQTMAQASVGSYMDFLNSMFSYYQGTVQQVQRQTGNQG